MCAGTWPILSNMGLLAQPYGTVMFLKAVSPLKHRKQNNPGERAAAAAAALAKGVERTLVAAPWSLGVQVVDVVGDGVVLERRRVFLLEVRSDGLNQHWA